MTENKGMLKPWYNGEYHVLTEQEYEILVRYHDETCTLKRSS